MEVLDPGHNYLLDSYDGGDPIKLTFVKRDQPPEKYPGNVGHYPGTIVQEVLRALLERCRYVYKQAPNPETEASVELLRMALYLFELRANRIHGRALLLSLGEVERAATCHSCGHIQCGEHDSDPDGAGARAVRVTKWQPTRQKGGG